MKHKIYRVVYTKHSTDNGRRYEEICKGTISLNACLQELREQGFELVGVKTLRKK